MAVYINTLNGGNITVGGGGSPTPSGHSETRFTLEGGTVETYDITGTLDRQWMIDNGYWIPWDYEKEEGDEWAKTIIQADIGNTVTSIGDYAFLGCSGLTSVTIPDSVTSIGYEAFYGCSGLMGVTLPNSVTSIGDGVFRECGLTSVTIPDSVTSIREFAFSGSGLTSVTIPDSVTSIGNWAFGSCSGLTSVTIPDRVTSIGECAFENCSGLTSVTIGAGVTSIGDRAFEGCSGLTSVMIPDSVTSIGEYVFSDIRSLTSVTFNSFTKNQIKSMATENYLFGDAFYDPNTWEPMAKSFTVVCTDGSMTINFSADYTITFTDL